MAWAHNNWKNASFNPYKKDHRLLEGTVTAVRQHKESKQEGSEKKDEQVQMDLGNVLSKPPDARLKWLQRSLQFVASKEKTHITTLYDIVLHKKFAAGISVELARHMLELLLAHLHMFSVRQKIVLESKLGILGAYLDDPSEDGSSSDADLVFPDDGVRPARSRSPSWEGNGTDEPTIRESTSNTLAEESDNASTAIATVANVAAVAAVASAAKAAAVANQEAAAAAAAAPTAIPTSKGVWATTEAVFPSNAEEQILSQSGPRHVKKIEEDTKRNHGTLVTLKSTKKKEKAKTKEKEKSKQKDKKGKSRSRTRSGKKKRKRTRSRSGKRKNKKSRSRSRSKKKKDKDNRSRSKSKKKKKPSKSTSSSSDVSPACNAKKDRSASEYRSSPRRGPDGHSMWLPPRESAKEAVALGRDDHTSELVENAARRASMLAANQKQHVPGVNPHMRPGDWLCPLCGAHNYSSKTQCFRCIKLPPHSPSSVPSAAFSTHGSVGASMPGLSSVASPIGTSPQFGQDSLQAAQLNAARRLAAVPSPAAPVRSGDWFCSVCSAHNFASKSKCFRCMKGVNPRMGGLI